MERSLVLVKPDGMQRGLAGEVLYRFEKKGMKITGLKMIQLDLKILQEHYFHHKDKPFFPELAEFMQRTPVVAMVIEGPKAVEIVRLMCGEKMSDMGSIRGDYCSSKQRNIVHSSDSKENAELEIKRFFTENEIFEYSKDEWKHTFSSVEHKV